MKVFQALILLVAILICFSHLIEARSLKSVKYVPVDIGAPTLKDLQDKSATTDWAWGNIAVESGFPKDPYAEIIYVLPGSQSQSGQTELYVNFVSTHCNVGSPGPCQGDDSTDPVQTYRVDGSKIVFGRNGVLQFDLQTKAQAMIKLVVPTPPTEPFGLKAKNFYE